MYKSYALVVVAACVILTGCGSREDSAARHLETARQLFDSGDLIKARLELRNAVQLEPRNAEARYLLALISEREQDARGTLGNLQLAIDADPNHIAARVKLGSYYVVGRRPEEAREFADKALELAPQSPQVHVLNARVLLLEGKPDAALQEADLALSLGPDQREAISLAALLQARAGDVDRSMAIIDGGLDVVSAADVESLRQSRVSILAEVGERERGLAELESMVADYPDTLSYQMALAELYLGAGRTEEAEALIRDLVARDPDNAEWRIRLARILVRQDRSGDAESSLQQAVSNRPDAMGLRLALAGFYEQSGRIEESLAVYQGIADVQPRSDEGFAARNRIAALNVGRDDAEARAMIAGILADAPDNADALLLRAALRISDNEVDEAIADLRLVLVKRPTSIRALLGIARAQVLSGNPALAEEAYRKVLAADPANAPATRELAVLVGNRGDTAEAETLLRRALRIEPGDPNASRNLVNALLIQQDFQAAEAEARRMVSHGAVVGVADYQLGLALEAQQDLDGAVAAYKEALLKAPTADAPLNSLVRVLVKNGRAGEAGAYLEQHVDNHPEHLQGRLLLAEVYASQGQVADAEAVYHNALADNPEAVGAYVGWAGLYPPDSDERLAVIEDGVAKFPASAQLGLALGSTYEKRRDYERAIRAYERAWQATDNDIIANNLAALLLDFRTDAASFEHALQLASRFERRTDRHPLNLAVLGWAYYRNGDYAKATRYLEQAVAQVQQAPQLRYYLGMAYLNNDNPVGARQELRIAVDEASASGLTFTGLDEARATLESLDKAVGS